MDSKSLEGKVDSVTQRLSAVENSLNNVSTGDLVAFQQQMLIALRQLRETMQAEATTANSSSTSLSEGALREENEALKKQVAKLNYRINHLLRHIPVAK